MYLSALTAIERKNGKSVILASVAYPNAGRDTSKVAAAYRALVAGTKEGAEKRAKYSHVMLMIENTVRNTHQFPDAAVLAEKQARKAATAASTAEREAIVKRLAEAEASKSTAEQALAEIRGRAIQLGIIDEPEDEHIEDKGKQSNPVEQAALELRQKANAAATKAREAIAAAEKATGLALEDIAALHTAGKAPAEHLEVIEIALAAATAAAQADSDASEAEAALRS